MEIAPPLPFWQSIPESTNVEALDEEHFGVALSEEVTELGSISIGAANRGFLFNGVAMPESERWIVLEPEHSFGTLETVSSLANAIDAVHRLYPDTHKLFIGHLSRERGGWLRPHRSHQSGRDVDLGFYYLGEAKWYQKATSENFDIARNWALLSAMMKTSEVEYIFIDRSLHEPLRQQAHAVGESPDFVTIAFDGVDLYSRPLIRHARGHDDHMHVRFASKVAVDNARRAHARLGKKARNGGVLLNLLIQKRREQQKPSG